MLAEFCKVSQSTYHQGVEEELDGFHTNLHCEQNAIIVKITNIYANEKMNIKKYRKPHTQCSIDFVLTQKVDSRCRKHCKVIPRESVTTQHMQVLLDICIMR